jgi:propanol-preferring alcohol dehydrogenase
LTGIQDGFSLGFTGFGASAHLVLKIAKHKYPNSKIYVFARSRREREFARELGAHWAGPTEGQTPEKLDCIIDTTPAWKPRSPVDGKGDQKRRQRHPTGCACLSGPGSQYSD